MLLLETLEARTVPSVTPVPLPPGAPDTHVINAFVVSVNGNNEVAGTAAAASGSPSGLTPGANGFVWTQTGGTQTIFPGGRVLAVNSSGQVLGTLNNGTTLELWDPTHGVTVIPLPQQGGPFGGDHVDQAYLNDQGQVAGTAKSTYSFSGSGDSQGFLWTADLGTQAIVGCTRVLGENNHGQVLGDGPDHLDVWGASGDLPIAVTLPAGDAYVSAASLNDNGQVAGNAGPSSTSGPTDGFVSQVGTPSTLVQTFSGGQVFGQNNQNAVLVHQGGLGSDPLDIWTPTPNGQPTTVTVPLPTGSTVTNASINDAGQVAGNATSGAALTSSSSSSPVSGSSNGFVWTPAVNSTPAKLTTFTGEQVYGQSNTSTDGQVLHQGATVPLDLGNGTTDTAIPLPPQQTSLSSGFLNDAGQVAGNAQSSGYGGANIGFVWTKTGGTQPLSVTNGNTTTTLTTVRAQNQNGDVLGTTANGTLELWKASDKSLTAVPLPSGTGVRNAFLNDQDQVAATSSNSSGNTNGFVWSSTLGTPAGTPIVIFTGGRVLGENSGGDVLGTISNNSTLELWHQQGATTATVTLPQHSTTVTNGFLNDQDQVAATANFSFSNPAASSSSSGTNGFVWTSTMTQPNVIFPGGSVLGENNKGQVVGETSDNSLNLWDPKNGLTLIPLAGSVNTSDFIGVNDQGQVAGNAGFGYYGYGNSGFLWTPKLGTQTLGAGIQAEALNNSGAVLAGTSAGVAEIWTGGGITFKHIPDQTYGKAGAIALSASAPGSHHIFFQVESGNAQVQYPGNKLLLTGAGTVIVGAGSDISNGSMLLQAFQVAKDTTTVQLTSSIDASHTGQNTTLTATVVPGGKATTTPEGTVTFFNGATKLNQQPITLSNGVATLTESFGSTGTNSLTAVYSGDDNYKGSTSKPLKQNVVTPTSTTTLVQPANIVYGQPGTLTATVVSSDTSVKPTGMVSFFADGTLIGTAQLGKHGAMLPTTKLDASSTPQTLTAVYSGNTKVAGSVTTGTPVTITVGEARTQTTLTVKPSAGVYGQQFTLTAKVTPVAPSQAVPTGSVDFVDQNSHFIGEAQLVNGVATLKTRFIDVSVTSVKAEYFNDDGNESDSNTPTPVSVHINAAATTVKITSVHKNSDGSVTLTAAVKTTAPSTVQPIGTVQFFENGKAVSAAGPVINGKVTLTVSVLKTGKHTLTATYSPDQGDLDFKSSMSKPFTAVIH